MKLKTLLAYLYLAIYTAYAPDFLVEFINQACQMNATTANLLKFSVMLSGFIAFMVFAPIEPYRAKK
ncbi:TPA: hypothetical protein ACGF1T_002863 [Vibrio cholerae]